MVRLFRLPDGIILPHILPQTGSILGGIVSENKQLTGSVINGIYSPPAYVRTRLRISLNICQSMSVISGYVMSARCLLGRSGNPLWRRKSALNSNALRYVCHYVRLRGRISSLRSAPSRTDTVALRTMASNSSHGESLWRDVTVLLCYCPH